MTITMTTTTRPSINIMFYSVSAWLVCCCLYVTTFSVDAFAPSTSSWVSIQLRNRSNEIAHKLPRPLSSPLTSSISSASSSSASLSSSSSTSSLPPAYIIEKVSTCSPPPSEKTFRKIAKMCIPVFFDEQNNTNNGPGWVRQYKLNYLINLQSADLRVRRNWYPDTNEMFVAYEVALADEDEYLFLDSNSNGNGNGKSKTSNNPKQLLKRIRNRSSASGRKDKELKPLILDIDQIYNLSSLRQKQREVEKQRKMIMSSFDNDGGSDDGEDVTTAKKKKKAEMLKRLSSVEVDSSTKDMSATDNFVKGNIIGFVEITKKPYGLGSAATTANDTNDNGDNDDLFMKNDHETKQETGGDNKKKNNVKKKPAVQMNIRPVLTNLAVAKHARKGGVGSKLVDQCEDHIQNVWKMNELVLEVEDYNESALKFYTKRGFKVLYSDPASRRYDLSGFFPEKVRCRRDILRKVYSPTQNLFDMGGITSNVQKMTGLFTRIQQLMVSK